MHTYIFLFCHLRGPRNDSTSVAASRPNTQNLVFNTLLQSKEPGLLRETADSRTGAGNTQGKPGAPYCARSKELLRQKIQPTMMGVCQSDTEVNSESSLQPKLE